MVVRGGGDCVKIAPMNEPASLPQADYAYAGFFRRAAALFIDLVLLGLIGLVVGFLMGMTEIMTTRGANAETMAEGLSGNAIGLAISLLYFASCESSRHQASPGKRMLGLVVTDLEGRRIGFGRAALRWAGRILSGLILCIGYFLMNVTKRRQTLHDLLSGCLVLHHSAKAGGEEDRARFAGKIFAKSRIPAARKNKPQQEDLTPKL